MKKLSALLLSLAMVVSLAACGGDKNPTPDAGGEVENDAVEIALVTDVGNIDDKSFNQAAWEGVKEYSEANGINYDYFRPSEDSTVARVESIETAIAGGAKVVVCPGFLFEDAIFEVQDKHPDVQFLLLDGTPHSADFTEFKTADNTACILYQEEQAGYLAGYAAVQDGYRKLGFMGGIDVPAVVRFGFGFVQGVNAAAEELGITDEVEIKYTYTGTFAPDDAIKTKAAGWYTAGTEVIFASGGGIYVSICAAANEAGAKVIGVDKDQSFEDASIITSAMKALNPSVQLALTNLYANGGKWGTEYAGQTMVLGAKDNCVGLPTETWSMENYTVEQYNELFAKLVDGTVVVSNSIEAAPEVAVAVDYNA